MPRTREDLHRAVCRLDSCRKEFFQRRPGQEYCSQACSNRAFPGVGGKKPAAGLPLRACEYAECQKVFQPYRDSQRTCSKQCYRKLPDVVDSVRTHHAQPHIKERKNAARRVGTAKDPAVRREINLKSQLRRYGITPEQYRAKLIAQGGVCALCGRLPKPNGVKAASRLHNDHDHETGQNRDLLCNDCNIGIGKFRDDPELLRAAAAYIERHRAAVTVST